MKRILVLSLLLLFIPVITTAQNDNSQPKLPIDNGYPYFLTSSVFPMDQGLLEWTIAPMYTHGSSERNLILLPQLNYGITDSLQIGTAFIPYMIHWEQNLCGEWESHQGISDLNLNIQYSWVYIKKTQCCASVFFSVTLPTGDINKGLTDGLIHYTPSIILTKDFIHDNWRTQLFMETSVSLVQRAQRPEDRFRVIPPAHDFYFNAGIAERSEKINYSLEFNWITNTWNHEGTDDEKYITPGVYIYVRKDVAIGLGVPIGLTQDADKYEIIGNLLIDIETIFSKKEDKEQDKESKTNALRKQGATGRSLLMERTRPSSSSSTPLSAPPHRS